MRRVTAESQKNEALSIPAVLLLVIGWYQEFAVELKSSIVVY